MDYGKKLTQKILAARHAGYFTEEEARERGMRYVMATLKSAYTKCALYLLVDESDGVIADAKFQAFGPPALIGAAEAACELLIRKNYDQARKISGELLDKQCRDQSDIAAFPQDTYSYLNLVLDLIEEAAVQCLDIPLAAAYVPTPLGTEIETSQYPDWDLLTQEQKIAVIEEVIATEIRPYIELDAGGVDIVDLVGSKLIIAYQGACTSCYSATGSTLNAIQQILEAKVHPSLEVVPDLLLR